MKKVSTLASLCATPDQCQGMCLGEMLTTAVIRTLGLIFVAADYIPLHNSRSDLYSEGYIPSMILSEKVYSNNEFG